MSNDLVLPSNATALATAQNAFAGKDFTQSVAGDNLKRISIRGGMFRLMSGKQEIAVREERSLDVVVVGAAPHVHRQFYEGAYQEGVDASPACWSSDGNAPDADARKQSDTCNTCPKNVKGSATDGKGKACRYVQRIAVALANDMGGDVYGVQLPAMSIFGDTVNGGAPFRPYATFLSSQKVPMPSVVTKMRFDTNSAVPKLLFSCAGSGYIGDDNVPIVRKQMERDEVAKLIELKVFKQDTAASGVTPATVTAAVAPTVPVVPAGAASTMSAAVTAWQTEE